MTRQPEKKGVFCIRNQAAKPADEHMECPYCFGRRREVIEDGERRDFCDYDPTTDPVTFGFPSDTARNANR